jgi:hypothetical protein
MATTTKQTNFAVRDWELQALRDGRLTQLRRVIEPQPFLVLSRDEWHSRAMSGADPYGFKPIGAKVLEDLVGECPHPPGSTLCIDGYGTLTVKRVRVERVQEISNSDVIACGMVRGYYDGYPVSAVDGCRCIDLRHIATAAWIDYWDRNDPCWVIEFKRLTDGATHGKPNNANA